MRPGRITKKIFKHLSSAKRKESLLFKRKKIKQTGIASVRVYKIPAVITFLFLSNLPSAEYFVIRRDTVMGVPEQIRVKIKPKTERATEYNPTPSEPMVLER